MPKYDFEKLRKYFEIHAEQFKLDGFTYYAEKTAYDKVPDFLCSRGKEQFLDATYSMFEILKKRLGGLCFCPAEYPVILNSTTTQFIQENKYYTNTLLYITFRPADDDPHFFKMVKGLFDKDIIDAYIYVYEQAGNGYTNLGKGQHIHGIIKFKSTSEFKTYNQAVKKYFKDYISKCSKSVELFPIKQKHLIIDKLYYMGLHISDDEIDAMDNLTFKNTEEKQAKLPYDKIYRERNNLDRYYCMNEYEIIKIYKSL